MNIQGDPSKSFFIGMITRDISIKDAILDLLDNSIDGANNINPDSYIDRYIRVNISKDEFSVIDNCGGFSLDIAQKYAFRFGRPDDAPQNGGSIGRFGVGMKRALFKIGQQFEVESKTNSDHFVIKDDVNVWKNKKKEIIQDNQTIYVDDWSFNLTNEVIESQLTENGTFIRIISLNEEVASIFEDQAFLSELKDNIERILNFSIEKGLRIELNGIHLKKKDIHLLKDKSIPYSHTFTSDNVKVKIFAGLSSIGNPQTSGWYIYCNDRLVIDSDKTEITGWGIKGVPKWHMNFVMFKGVVFMDSDETIKLPLTTTKKGIDSTSTLYKNTLFYMRESMISVLNFLKEVGKLGNEANDYRKLLVEQEYKITVQSLKNLSTQNERVFICPELDSKYISEKNNNARISFNVSIEKANIAIEHSNTKNFKELGEYIFNYYLKMEDLDNE